MKSWLLAHILLKHMQDKPVGSPRHDYSVWRHLCGASASNPDIKTKDMSCSHSDHFHCSQYVLVLFSTRFVWGWRKGRLMFQFWTHFSPQEVGTSLIHFMSERSKPTHRLLSMYARNRITFLIFDPSSFNCKGKSFPLSWRVNVSFNYN